MPKTVQFHISRSYDIVMWGTVEDADWANIDEENPKYILEALQDMGYMFEEDVMDIADENIYDFLVQEAE